MSRLTDRLERDLREIGAGARPSASAWESIVARLDEEAGSEIPLAPTSDLERSKSPVWLAVAAAVLLVVIASFAVATGVADDRSISTTGSDLTKTFVSPRNGFSVKHSEDATVAPAEQLWGFSKHVDDGFDVMTTGSGNVFRGASAEFPGGGQCASAEALPNSCGSIDAQVDRYLAVDYVWPGACGVPRSQQAEITIDGRSGRVAECSDHVEATVVFGGRLYLFTLSDDRDDARAAFDAFVATIELTPETAIEYPGMTSTFVSPTHGYSFDYHDRGGLEPATERWDPASQPVEERNFDRRFDGVETGLGAYFEAASTVAPEGVSINEWVDTYVTSRTAGGCGVPRSGQEEISIDGRPARKAACAHAEATVVAGGRLYLFIGPNDDREWFDAWLATIELTPETAESTR